MRLLQSSLFRAVSSIAIGVLLIKYPDNTLEWIVIAIGVLFLLSGVVSCLSYFNARRHAGELKVYDSEGRLIAGDTPMFPIVGVGSIILGLILTLMPTQFVTALMYVIGAILILGALGQFFTLISVRSFARLSALFWVLPSVIFLIGLYVLIKPLGPADIALTVLGWLSLVYGVSETINALKIYSCRRKLEQEQKKVGGFVEAEEVKEP